MIKLHSVYFKFVIVLFLLSQLIEQASQCTTNPNNCVNGECLGAGNGNCLCADGFTGENATYFINGDITSPNFTIQANNCTIPCTYTQGTILNADCAPCPNLSLLNFTCEDLLLSNTISVTSSIPSTNPVTSSIPSTTTTTSLTPSSTPTTLLTSSSTPTTLLTSTSTPTTSLTSTSTPTTLLTSSSTPTITETITAEVIDFPNCDLVTTTSQSNSTTGLNATQDWTTSIFWVVPGSIYNCTFSAPANATALDSFSFTANGQFIDLQIQCSNNPNISNNSFEVFLANSLNSTHVSGNSSKSSGIITTQISALVNLNINGATNSTNSIGIKTERVNSYSLSLVNVNATT